MLPHGLIQQKVNILPAQNLAGKALEGDNKNKGGLKEKSKPQCQGGGGFERGSEAHGLIPSRRESSSKLVLGQFRFMAGLIFG